MLTSTHWGVYDVAVEDGRIVGIAPFDRDPDPSPLGQSLSAVTGPLRVQRPAVRRSYLEGGPGAACHLRGAEPFVEVSWQEALDLAAAELQRVKTAHGNSAIFAGSYGWSSAGRFHHAQSQIHRFMNAIGGYVAHVGTYSLGAARTLLPRILMDMDAMRAQHTAWVALEKQCELLVAFGGIPAKNAQVNNGGAALHEVRPSLERLARAGVRFVNVSPLRDDLAAAPGAEWVAIRPNTDAAFMLALAHTWIAGNRHDRAFLDRYCTGFDEFRRYVMGETDGVMKNAAWAAGICDIPAGTIVALALSMAEKRTMISVAWALQRGDHGEQPYWLGITLAALLGQIGTPGGGFALGYGPVNVEGSNARPMSGPVLPQGQNAVKTPIPVARITDMLENPGGEYRFDGRLCTYPDIRLVYWAGGNPFHHHQDLNRFVRAWRSKPETIVVNEQYWNPNAKMADIVLPATTMLEREDIGSSSRDRFVIAMKRALDPVGEARDDYEIFSGIAGRLGAKAAYTEGRSTMAWLRHLYEGSRDRAAKLGIAMPSFEAFWSEGVIELPPPDEPPVMLKAYREDPEANRLPTPSGKIEIFSSTIASFGYDDCLGHPAWFEPAEWLGAPLAAKYPLHLISHQPATRLHSQYDHGVVSLAAKIAGREAMTIHPADAAARGLKTGDVVRVYNDRGACLAGVRVDDGVRPGVVILPTGAWYDPLDPAEPGTLEKHGNPNVLTLDKGTSSLTQGCSAHTTLVEVEKLEGEPPPVTAFDPPVLLRREA